MKSLTDTNLTGSVYNFTDVFVGDKATLSFVSSGLPHDIYLLSSGDVTIRGNIIAPGMNLYISAANNFSLTGSIDVNGGVLSIYSGTAPVSTALTTAGITLYSGGGLPVVGGTVSALVPVPPSLSLFLGGLSLLFYRRSNSV
ncbi:MAG: hypothetical protein ACYDC8_10895 [Gammaproteobacteria bacterium]